LESSIDDPFPAALLFVVSMLGSPLLFYLLNALILVVLLFLSAMVSGSEVAFFSMAPAEIIALKSGNKPERTLYRLISDPKRLLATILILNNFINIAIVTLSTFVTWNIVGSQSVDGQVVILLTFIVTFAIVYFGEVVPKIYANQRSLQFAKFTIPLISVSYWFFKPVSWFLASISNVIESRIKQGAYQVSIDELNHALELTTSHETSKEEKGILKGIVNFGQLSVKQVMRSRVDITALDVDTDFHDLMDKINKSGFSRIPVYKETIDKIEGILYNKDLLPHIDKSDSFQWQTLIRPPYFVPEAKKIDTLLKDFQEKHVHMAIVVDEYGGTSGLITFEDVIEEIVGEIKDEFDDEEIVYNKLNDNTFIFEGKTSLHDFGKITEEDPLIFEAVKGESESLGGLLLELNNKLPRTGEKIIFDKFVFTVVAVDQKRIKRIRVLINK
jgi:gliding motility-associated protein GldE